MEKYTNLGAVKPNKEQFHAASSKAFLDFVSDSEYICGHNIIEHDMKYLNHIWSDRSCPILIDTLPLSPLLFPRKPYHNLLKDDKIQSDEKNNPLNDSIKAMYLFYDEINEFYSLPQILTRIYYTLLYPFKQFQGFFKFFRLQFAFNHRQGN